jgi:hypothetical protein
MKKIVPRINITLSDPLRKELKRAAKESHLNESAFIREAIKFYLRERINDPLLHLQPKEEVISTLSKPERAQLLVVLQTFNLVQKLSRPEAIKEAGQWAADMASKLEAM